MDPKMDPKWTQNGAQNGPQTDPKWIPNGPQMGPEMEPFQSYTLGYQGLCFQKQALFYKAWGTFPDSSGSRHGTKMDPKIDPKMDPKWSPKWTQNGAQNAP